METKTESRVGMWVGIIALITSIVMGAINYFDNNNSKLLEAYEKESQYRTKTSEDIQNVQKSCESSLKQLENAYNANLLKQQKIIFDLKNEISTLKVSYDNLKRQNEYVQSQNTLKVEALRAECENKYKKK